jgi:hypothetical protein
MLNAKAPAKVYRMLISGFSVQNDLKQGDVLSLLLFIFNSKVLESQDGLWMDGTPSACGL